MDATDSGAGDTAGVPRVAVPRFPSFRAVAPRLLSARITHPTLQGLLAFATYLTVFIVGFGLPLASHLNVPNIRQYWTDPQFYAWSLRWWPYAVSHWTNPLFSNQIGAPHGYNLAWASTTPSVDLLMWPVTAAFGVLVSYNVLLLIVPPISAWAAFVAARRLTGRFWASLLAGVVYGFSPYELIHNWQGQPNLTVLAVFPLMVYLVVRWWQGALSWVWFTVWMAVAMAVQFYTFNEGFAEMTAVLAGVLVVGVAIAGRAAWRKAARLAGLTAIAYAGAVAAAVPYLVYSFSHYQGAVLIREESAYSLQFPRLIVPTSQQMFGVTPMIKLSNHLGRGGIDDYVGIPLLVILLLLVVFAWRSRVSWLLAVGFLFVLALAAGPILDLTPHNRFTLPWARLWTLPIARSAEPARFIVFGLLALSIALALWLALPEKGKPASREPKAKYKLITSRLLLAGRWGLGLLAVAAVITDTPTSYQAVNPLPQYYKPPATLHAVNQLPAFITEGLYRQYLRPGEIVAVFTQRGNAGMLFQAAANFYFRIAGGYINASLTPVNAVPHPLTAVANPSKVADQMLADYLRSAGVGAILVEQAWEDPWMHNMDRLGFPGKSVGGVIVYSVAPWLAHRAHAAGGPPRVVSSSSS